MAAELLNNLKDNGIESPVDKLTDQINDLISTGELKAGDKVPSERLLSERFSVGRMFVRDALSKLEFYGIIKKGPTGGRIVIEKKHAALMALATNTLSLVNPDYKSLMEVRYVLEVEAAGLAAERCKQSNIEALEEAVDLLGKKVSEGQAGIEEDLMFHIQVAEASGNDVFKYLVSYVVSHMMNYSKKYDICRDSRNLKAYNEHVVILEHIKNGDTERARQAMRSHLASLFDFIPKS